MIRSRAEKEAQLRADGPTRRLVEYLRDKRVVLVGPAGYLEGSGMGKEIDAFDVVIRLNLASPVPEALHADIGSRTDVLYHVLYSENHTRRLGRRHTPEEVAAWKADGVRFLVTRHGMTGDRVRRVAPILDGLPLVPVDERMMANLKKAVSTTPSTGIYAILHLLSMPIASLFVTGFDFYATGYHVGYGGFTREQAEMARGGLGYAAWAQLGPTREIHRQESQMDYLAALYLQEPRLSIDDVGLRRLDLAADGPTVTALVPMKGESERVPGKNVRPLCGKPLLFWTLAALHKARRVGRVVVDTDSEEIAELVRRHHPRTTVLMRPENLQGPGVTGNPLTEWEMTQVEGDHFLQTHVTNPLITPGTIDRAIDQYFDHLKEHDSLFAVTEHHFRLFNADGTPVNHEPAKLIRSQDLEPLYEDNSNLYVFSRRSFKAARGRIGKKPRMFPMSKLEAIDIDWPEDFELAEAVMERRLKHA